MFIKIPSTVWAGAGLDWPGLGERNEGYDVMDFPCFFFLFFFWNTPPSLDIFSEWGFARLGIWYFSALWISKEFEEIWYFGIVSEDLGDLVFWHFGYSDIWYLASGIWYSADLDIGCWNGRQACMHSANERALYDFRFSTVLLRLLFLPPFFCPRHFLVRWAGLGLGLGFGWLFLFLFSPKIGVSWGRDGLAGWMDGGWMDDEFARMDEWGKGWVGGAFHLYSGRDGRPGELVVCHHHSPFQLGLWKTGWIWWLIGCDRGI